MQYSYREQISMKQYHNLLYMLHERGEVFPNLVHKVITLPDIAHWDILAALCCAALIHKYRQFSLRKCATSWSPKTTDPSSITLLISLD